MIIVTGGAGFIGSNIVKGLNKRGIEDILIVDQASTDMNLSNLFNLKTSDYIDHAEFHQNLINGRIPNDIQAVIHQGACSNTMSLDANEMMKTNFCFSKDLLYSCIKSEVPLIYASSAAIYGVGTSFSVDPQDEAPLNIYAYSKYLFDRLVRKEIQSNTSQVVGLRYFNVYGPRESHKGMMASIVYQIFNQLRTSGKVSLFEGTDGFSSGEQRRDFIYVDDIVNVNCHMLENRDISGIVNVGTGRSRSFNDVAMAVINALRNFESKPKLSLEEAQNIGLITYKPMPLGLSDKYQSYTEADIRTLIDAGFTEEMSDLEDGVDAYVKILLNDQ